ncbi:MAG: energy-coupling factor transporter transmembrane protein EcfT [Defluviitaleaceae bacterium]|nr:energy-coupling factor transporter transmembrane protein EcfT [Defluviitaleaceae bacterium]MCL2239842.1 energy-coupling factor transporter transmembrane protein EcfT [Defluviitaleaceae bacterium]
MTRIAIGQFYPTDSPVHRLDPRVKLLAVIAFVTVLLFVTRFLGLGLAALFLAAIIRLSRVPARFLFRGLRMILFILIFASVINLFLTPGETILFSFGFIRLTAEGLYRAGLMTVRLVLLVIGSSLLTLTTSPIKLTDGIESLLRPFPLPAHDIAIMMTIALRMIPTLAEETDKIIKAQKARGADFETGSLPKRVKQFLAVLIPLFVSSFKRADELATAMEARCYRGGEGRTKMKPLKMKRADVLALAVTLLFCAGLIFLRFL